MAVRVHASLSAAVAVPLLLPSLQCSFSSCFVSPSVHSHRVLLFGEGGRVTRRRRVKERDEGECVLVSGVVEVPVAKLGPKMRFSRVEALKA